MVRVEPEDWMANKLGMPELFAVGVTDKPKRRELLREAILRRCLNYQTAGRNPEGKTETWAELFERVFEQPLDPTGSEGQTIPAATVAHENGDGV